MFHSLVFYLPAHHICDIHHIKPTLDAGDYASNMSCGFVRIHSQGIPQNNLPEAEESCVLSW